MGGLGQLQQQLYAKQSKLKPYARRKLGASEKEVQDSWEEKKPESDLSLVEKTKKKEKKERRPLTVYAKVFIASIVFFLLALAAAVAVFTFGQNQVVYTEVGLSVLGPNSIAGGDILSFDVTIANDNDSEIRLTDIIVTYPKGTVSAVDGLLLEKEIQSIDSLPAGTQDSRKFQAVLFGKEGDRQDIKVTYQYQVDGSNNLFTKERAYQVLIESAPVGLDIRSEGAYLSGSEVVIDVDIISNANKNVKNLLLEVDIPFGFTLASSSFEGLDGSNTYNIGTLKPGETKTLTLVGTLVGQDEEERVFRYILGVAGGAGKNEIGSVFTVADNSIVIQKPPVSLRVVQGGRDETIYIARPGQTTDFDINYANNVSGQIVDASITVEFEGQVYDKRSIKAGSGFFRSQDSSIVYDSSNTRGLAALESGKSSNLGFSFEVLPLGDLAGIYQNSEVTLDVIFRGTSFTQENEPFAVEVKETKRVKVATTMGLTQELLHSVGPFDNQGSLKPKVENLSTYTVVWKLRNSLNAVSDVELRAKLPGYINYTETLLPANANLQYNERTRELVWQPGRMVAGVGYTTLPNELAFVVAFEPSLSQVGDEPLVLTGPVLQALDEYTDQTFELNFDELDTGALQNDPGYVNGSEFVGE